MNTKVKKASLLIFFNKNKNTQSILLQIAQSNHFKKLD